jgi:hypothetical protein
MIKIKITFKYNKNDKLYRTINFHLKYDISYIFTKKFHDKIINNITKKYIVDNDIYPQYSLYSKLKLFKYDKEYKDVIDNIIITEINVRFN